MTIDYRGYGDTVMNGTLGETTLVEDSKAAIKLVRQACPSNKVQVELVDILKDSFKKLFNMKDSGNSDE